MQDSKPRNGLVISPRVYFAYLGEICRGFAIKPVILSPVNLGYTLGKKTGSHVVLAQNASKTMESGEVRSHQPRFGETHLMEGVVMTLIESRQNKLRCDVTSLWINP